MRKYLTALSIAGFIVCALALSMNEEGHASERDSAKEAIAEAADIDAQRQLAFELEGESPESFSSDAGIRTAMNGHIDISVSRIGYNNTSSSSYDEYGVFEGIAAFSSATTACNVGGKVAEWFGSTSNRHPLIAQNMYRMSADGERFEMIGMSWLKHSFCALSETTCGACQATSCSTLGIGCADTYTASRNGSSFLGPRRDVNPLGLKIGGDGPGTHDHPYPAPIDDSRIKGRLQVKTSDLSKAGAKYYVEVHYVTHDESLNYRYNNASWMYVSMPPAPYTANITNNLPLNEKEIALIAWQNEWEGTKTPVMIQEIVDTQRGMFQLGWRVSYKGNSIWHYEYALHNMNSRLAASSFAIPIGEGVTVTNVGFHDVFYHGGDGYPGSGTFDGTDWASADTGAGGSRVLAWSTGTFDDNPNGNALRWGTTYNFRFDANTPPQEVTATIVHYRGSTDGPGLPVSVTGLTQGPSAQTGGCFCQYDPDLSGDVGAFDLALLLGCWGPVKEGTCECLQADPIDGVISAWDLANLLSKWGPCP